MDLSLGLESFEVEEPAEISLESLENEIQRNHKQINELSRVSQDLAKRGMINRGVAEAICTMKDRVASLESHFNHYPLNSYTVGFSRTNLKVTQEGIVGSILTAVVNVIKTIGKWIANVFSWLWNLITGRKKTAAGVGAVAGMGAAVVRDEQFWDKVDSQTAASGNNVAIPGVSDNLSKFLKTGDDDHVRSALRLDLVANRQSPSELRAVVSTVKRMRPNLFAKYEARDFFTPAINGDRKAWDAGYFYRQAGALRTNFSEQRVEHLIDVYSVLGDLDKADKEFKDKTEREAREAETKKAREEAEAAARAAEKAKADREKEAREAEEKAKLLEESRRKQAEEQKKIAEDEQKFGSIVRDLLSKVNGSASEMAAFMGGKPPASNLMRYDFSKTKDNLLSVIYTDSINLESYVNSIIDVSNKSAEEYIKDVKSNAVYVHSLIKDILVDEVKPFDLDYKKNVCKVEEMFKKMGSTPSNEKQVYTSVRKISNTLETIQFQMDAYAGKESERIEKSLVRVGNLSKELNDFAGKLSSIKGFENDSLKFISTEIQRARDVADGIRSLCVARELMISEQMKFVDSCKSHIGKLVKKIEKALKDNDIPDHYRDDFEKTLKVYQKLSNK